MVDGRQSDMHKFKKWYLVGKERKEIDGGGCLRRKNKNLTLDAVVAI